MSHKLDPTLTNGLVDVIREIVQEQTKEQDTSVLAEVVQLKGDNHVDVYVYPDTSNVIHNVLNNSGYPLNVGDFVYLYKPHNQIAQAFIISKIMPYAGQINNIVDVGSSNSSGIYNGWFTVKYFPSESKWKVVLNAQLIKLLNQETSISTINFGIIRYISAQTHQGKNIAPYRSYNKKGYTYTQEIGLSASVGGVIALTRDNTSHQLTETAYEISSWMTNLIKIDYQPEWIRKISRARYKTYLKQGYWFRKYGFWIIINDKTYTETTNCLEVRNYANDPINPNSTTATIEIDGLVVKIKNT